MKIPLFYFIAGWALLLLGACRSELTKYDKLKTLSIESSFKEVSAAFPPDTYGFVILEIGESGWGNKYVSFMTEGTDPIYLYTKEGKDGDIVGFRSSNEKLFKELKFRLIDLSLTTHDAGSLAIDSPYGVIWYGISSNMKFIRYHNAAKSVEIARILYLIRKGTEPKP
ncbi:MAG: hypothetical protein RIQ79_2478 [Verrucomicrobiota bacterium]|jgi:hypothetical protein